MSARCQEHSEDPGRTTALMIEEKVRDCGRTKCKRDWKQAIDSSNTEQLRVVLNKSAVQS